MSPGTSSPAGTSCCWPSRMTRAFGAAIFFSAASASSAFDSCTTPRMAFRTTMAMIAMASTHSPSSSEITAATIRMMIRKSLNWSSNREESRVAASPSARCGRTSRAGPGFQAAKPRMSGRSSAPGVLFRSVWHTKLPHSWILHFRMGPDHKMDADVVGLVFLGPHARMAVVTGDSIPAELRHDNRFSEVILDLDVHQPLPAGHGAAHQGARRRQT